MPKHIFGIPTDVLTTGKALPPKGAPVVTDINKMLDTINGDLTRLGLPKPDHDALASHPIMNTQILHYLSHGDLTAKGRCKGIRWSVRDLCGWIARTDRHRDVLHRIRVQDAIFRRRPVRVEGRPGRSFISTSFTASSAVFTSLGFTEFADAAYRRFDEMALLIVADINATETGVARAYLDDLRANDRPDLRGGKVYLDSPRHANYVHNATFIKASGGAEDESSAGPISMTLVSRHCAATPTPATGTHQLSTTSANLKERMA